jgi:hypothetical protein
MKTHRIYCEFHLGDCFSILHLLHYLAKLHPDHQFEFYAHKCYLPEFVPLVDYLPNLTLWDLERGIPEGAINGWKQADDFWASHPLKNDYVAFTKCHYRKLIRKMGFTDPAPGLLFDFPCLEPHADWGIIAMLRGGFDVLLVNSAPCSGQFMDYSHDGALDDMARALDVKNRVLTTKKVDDIPCTRDQDLSCADIGCYSNEVPVHIMVSTGPSWLCMNVFSQPKYRLIMAQHEHVNICPETVWARSIQQAMDELQKAGLI